MMVPCAEAVPRKLSGSGLGFDQHKYKLRFAFLPTASSLHVSLMSRQPQVKLTSTVDLACIVGAGYSDLQVPLTVTWRFQPAGSQVSHHLVRVTHNGTIEWGDFPSQFQRRTKISQSSFRSQLSIHDATEAEAGVYQCTVEVYDRNALPTNGPARASASSHPLRIVISLPGNHHSELTPAFSFFFNLT